MDLTYKLAELSDLDSVVELVQRSINHMLTLGINQWDELYPTRDDFKYDIENRQLYVGTDCNRIAVIFVINSEYDPEYADGKWTYNGKFFRVIHRLCVDPDFQHKGIAASTLLYIEQLLSAQGIKAIRLDAFTENPYAIKLYSHNGYHNTGYVTFRKGKFALMEKSL